MMSNEADIEYILNMPNYGLLIIPVLCSRRAAMELSYYTHSLIASAALPFQNLYFRETD